MKKKNDTVVAGEEVKCVAVEMTLLMFSGWWTRPQMTFLETSPRMCGGGTGVTIAVCGSIESNETLHHDQWQSRQKQQQASMQPSITYIWY